MCGISGFIDFKEKSTQDILEKMLQTIRRRGPDGQGSLLLNTHFAQIGLAHSRLSILDLSKAGCQPYHFENLYLIYNGEVYNFEEIQRELEISGYTFQSHSDTEVTIKAFHCWGVDAVHKFRGMFAFCLYDSKAQKVYLFRDRAGVKPLYYYRQNGLLIFGSTLAPFMQHPGFKKCLSQSGLSQYMQWGYITAPDSIFENTFKVRPGHFILLDLRDQSLTEKQYWSIHTAQTPLSLSEEEATEQLEAILQESFQLRMVSDVSVGCFLSGGIDSSLVTAVLQKHSSTPLHTFTIGFEEQQYNEAEHAKKIAQYLGTRHTEHYCTKQDALNIIPQLPEMYDEPFADSSAIPTHFVAKLAKETVKVALSGDGGDELFGGYSVYARFPALFQKLKNLPARQAIALFSRFIPHTILSKKQLRLQALLPLTNDSLLYRTASSVLTPIEVKKLIGKHTSCSTLLLASTLAETMMFTDFETYLPEDILHKVDRATMFIGLEAREPLLDHKIIEYAVALPLAYKQQKKILKKILANYLPQPLFERKKQGFGLPLNQWLQSDLKPLVNEYLDEKRLNKHGIFNPKHVKQLKHNLFSGKLRDQQDIWVLLMFQIWHERYFS